VLERNARLCLAPLALDLLRRAALTFHATPIDAWFTLSKLLPAYSCLAVSYEPFKYSRNGSFASSLSRCRL
jgi:hypothetical protein